VWVWVWGPHSGGGGVVCITSLVGNLDAEDLSTLNEWEKEEGLRSEDAANTAIPPQLYSTIFLPFQLHQLEAIPLRKSFISLFL